jgi:hypothetical protein
MQSMFMYFCKYAVLNRVSVSKNCGILAIMPPSLTIVHWNVGD